MTKDNEKDEQKFKPYNLNNILITKEIIADILSKMNITNLKIDNLKNFQMAFVHKSYCKKKFEGNENLLEQKPSNSVDLQEFHNERIEFLGDSIVNSATNSYLYERYKNQDEGFMTKLKTKLISGEYLSQFAKHMNLKKYILISRHVENMNGRNNDRILEDVFESFLGALYLDFGFDICKQLIYNILNTRIDWSDMILYENNFKDILMKHFQKQKWPYPQYKEITVRGPPNNRIFEIGIYNHDNDLLGTGTGHTKKKCEQIAAHNALLKLNIVNY
jgi:ribonuclease III